MVIGDLFFGMTEKCKNWFESPEISFVVLPGEDMEIEVRPVDFKYFLKEFTVNIDNKYSGFGVNDYPSRRNLFRREGIDKNNEYNQMTMDIISEVNNMSDVQMDLKKYISRLADSGRRERDVTFLVGKGTLEDVSRESEGEFFYYSMVNVSGRSGKGGSGFIGFYPKNIVFYRDPASGMTEIVDEESKIWGGGKQYVTLFDISGEDFEAGKIQPGKTDEQGWFVLEDLKISVLED